jgi:hypothetical protein
VGGRFAVSQQQKTKLGFDSDSPLLIPPLSKEFRFLKYLSVLSIDER